MSNENRKRPHGFFPRHAKLLSHRVHQPYSIIEDQYHIQWLVDAVLDNGRMMSLFQVGSGGQCTRTMTAGDYHNYTIVLGPFDKKGNEIMLDTRFSNAD